MLIHQRLCLLTLQVNGKPIVVVRTPRVVSVSVLPVHVRHLLLERDRLPSADGLEAGDVGHGAQVLEALLGSEPAVLLVDDGLVDGAGGFGVVLNPLVGPGNSLYSSQ